LGDYPPHEEKEVRFCRRSSISLRGRKEGQSTVGQRERTENDTNGMGSENETGKGPIFCLRIALNGRTSVGGKTEKSQSCKASASSVQRPQALGLTNKSIGLRSFLSFDDQN